MITKREIDHENRRRRREEDEKFLAMLRDTSPEGKERLRQYFAEEERARAEHQKELETAVDNYNAAQKREELADQQTYDDIIHGRVLQRMGDYRQLYFYKKSKVIFDLTFHFCDRFITECHDRTKDQMVQAARSGKQNFVEGLQDGQADFEKATFLVTIGQGSLQELLEDYEDYLRTRGMAIWTENHERFDKLVGFCGNNNDIESYAPLFSKMNDEELANMAITLIHQTDVLIEGFLKKLEMKFIELGGVKERMNRIRKMAIGKTWK